MGDIPPPKRYRKPDVPQVVTSVLDIPSIWKYASYGCMTDAGLPIYLKTHQEPASSSSLSRDRSSSQKRLDFEKKAGTSSVDHENESEESSDVEPPTPWEGDQISDDEEEDVVEAVNTTATLEHRSSKSNTSRNTLEGTKMLNRTQLAEISRDLSVSHAVEKRALEARHYAQFPRWKLALKQGFSLLMYGYGSKKRLAEIFAHLMCGDGPLMVVDGFHPNTNPKMIIHSLTERLVRKRTADQLTGTESFAPRYDLIQALKDAIRSQKENCPKHIYLLIHNIDGEMLRNSRSQQLLSQLAELSEIHLIATIEHINGPLLWDNVTAGRFNWLYYDVTTFIPLTRETMFLPSVLSPAGDHLTADAVLSVLDNVVKNQREMWLAIANEQKDEDPNARVHAGVPIEKFFNECRAKLLVHTDMELRNALKEFFDHKILLRKRVGKEMKHERLFIPITRDVLLEVLEKIKAQEEAENEKTGK